MQTITLKQWQAQRRHGGTSVIDGRRHILTADDRGTCLAPVLVVGLDHVACDICGMEIRGGERFTDDGSEVTHAACVDGWFRRNYGRETLNG